MLDFSSRFAFLLPPPPLLRSENNSNLPAVFYVIDRVARLFFGLSPRSVSLVRVKAGGVVQLRFPKAYFATYRYVQSEKKKISLLR